MALKGSFDAVTGGGGFIGSHLCRQLLSEGRRVRVLDNFSSGKPGNLASLDKAHGSRFEVTEVDILDRLALAAACRGAERIFHLAALTSVSESFREPSLVNQVNVAGTLNVLEAAREIGAGRVVFASSSAVYGEPAHAGPVSESSAVRPLSPYAVSKLCGEHYCRLFSESLGLPTSVLRFFNVYGPRQDPLSPYAAVVPKFIRRVLQGLPPVIFGDGHQTRDFIFVGDVARAIVLATKAEESFVLLNVASGLACSIRELADRIAGAAGMSGAPDFQPARTGEIRHSLGDPSRASREVGFEASVSLEEGIRLTLEWHRDSSRGAPEPLSQLQKGAAS